MSLTDAAVEVGLGEGAHDVERDGRVDPARPVAVLLPHSGRGTVAWATGKGKPQSVNRETSTWGGEERGSGEHARELREVDADRVPVMRRADNVVEIVALLHTTRNERGVRDLHSEHTTLEKRTSWRIWRHEWRTSPRRRRLWVACMNAAARGGRRVVGDVSAPVWGGMGEEGGHGGRTREAVVDEAQHLFDVELVRLLEEGVLARERAVAHGL